MSAAEQPKRLGRGLEALLGPVNKAQAEASGALRELPMAQIEPNPYQPRTRFDETALAELKDSIAASGLLQPIVVRQAAPGRYQIVAGERRWRAVKQLGWEKVPAVVKSADDRTLLTLAMIENIQRHDLSSIDEALGYRRMQDEFGMAVTEIARLTGRNRATVANLLRLLQLPDDLQQLVHEHKLTEGHARALLGAADEATMRELANRAMAEGWSVRTMEAAVRGEGVGVATATNYTESKPKNEVTSATARLTRPKLASADVRRVEDALRKKLGTDAKVKAGRGGKGSVTLAFYSNDDLARLLELLLGEAYSG